ncbi:gamma-glutamyl-gamma-aminobutyrate hydrolase family protein [Xenorhabdus sp. SGI246]|uniref:glutamine amidotransferase-related protein n=1 Tax=Xenorhabdus sp. SGI246 TaxID=3158263 RepID=UPI00349F28F4
MEEHNLTGLIISFGPCTVKEAGMLIYVTQYFTGKIPILGICLGHQKITHAFSGNTIREYKVYHDQSLQIIYNDTVLIYLITS